MRKSLWCLVLMATLAAPSVAVDSGLRCAPKLRSDCDYIGCHIRTASSPEWVLIASTSLAKKDCALCDTAAEIARTGAAIAGYGQCQSTTFSANANTCAEGKCAAFITWCEWAVNGCPISGGQNCTSGTEQDGGLVFGGEEAIGKPIATKHFVIRVAIPRNPQTFLDLMLYEEDRAIIPITDNGLAFPGAPGVDGFYVVDTGASAGRERRNLRAILQALGGGTPARFLNRRDPAVSLSRRGGREEIVATAGRVELSLGALPPMLGYHPDEDGSLRRHYEMTGGLHYGFLLSVGNTVRRFTIEDFEGAANRGLISLTILEQ